VSGPCSKLPRISGWIWNLLVWRCSVLWRLRS